MFTSSVVIAFGSCAVVAIASYVAGYFQGRFEAWKAVRVKAADVRFHVFTGRSAL